LKILKNPILIFVFSLIGLFLFLYFYPAQIFEIEVPSGSLDFNQTKEVTLKEILNGLFSEENNFKIKTKSWLFLLIIFIGLPSMIAWRSTMKGHSRWKINRK